MITTNLCILFWIFLVTYLPMYIHSYSIGSLTFKAGGDAMSLGLRACKDDKFGKEGGIKGKELEEGEKKKDS